MRLGDRARDEEAEPGAGRRAPAAVHPPELIEDEQVLVGRNPARLAELGRLRADERLALLPEARRDKLSRLTFGATFRQLTLGGFAPVTRLVIERNRSTVEFYDYSRTRTEFALVRAF